VRPWVGYTIKLGVMRLDTKTSDEYHRSGYVREEIAADAAVLAWATEEPLRVVSDSGQTLLTLPFEPKVSA
jgi:hypothetical protein